MNYSLTLHRCLLTALAYCSVLAATSGHAQTFSDRYYAAAANGDISAIIKEIDHHAKMEHSGLTELDLRLIERIKERFIDQTETYESVTDNKFVNSVISVYRDYWIRSLIGEVTSDQKEDFLAPRLNEVLVEFKLEENLSEHKNVFDLVNEQIENEGYRHLGGETIPLLEFMLWKSNEQKEFEVELTDRSQMVNVIFMNGFLIRGWLEFASFGRSSAGGWATSEALFCVDDAYDLNSEKFLVSYLKHEARHFADNRAYPNLQQVDLEYRAKLTELAFCSETTHSVLGDFGLYASNDLAASPHSKANYAVVSALSSQILNKPFVAEQTEWAGISVEQINQTARMLLVESTKQLEDAGANTIRGLIDKKPHQ